MVNNEKFVYEINHVGIEIKTPAIGGIGLLAYTATPQTKAFKDDKKTIKEFFNID